MLYTVIFYSDRMHWLVGEIMFSSIKYAFLFTVYPIITFLFIKHRVEVFAEVLADTYWELNTDTVKQQKIIIALYRATM